jgi:hypothetical protein
MSALLTLILLVVFRSIGRVKGMTIGVMARLAPSGVAHDFLLLAEALRSRRGHFAWATCHTLIEMVCRREGYVKVTAKGILCSSSAFLL